MGSAVNGASRDRLIYSAVFVLLLFAEIMLGLFVHDSFIRPYLGDTLAVMLLWATLRILIPRKAVWISWAVFGFALLVELSQIIPLADLLGIENRLLRIIMGTSFSAEDILAYFIGCILTFIIDLFVFRQRERNLH